MGVSEIAQRLSLSKAVVHRTLYSLESRSLVEVDKATRRFSLGPGALALGLAYLERFEVIRKSAPEVLRDLSKCTSETATLSIRRGDMRLYIDQVTPPREVKMTVQLGHEYPLHAGSSSKAFLAHIPENEREDVLSKPLKRLTDHTIVDPDQLRKELALIRRQGYSVSLGERQDGAGSVAAPIFEHDGSPVAVISVCGPEKRFRSEIDRFARSLTKVTQRLSRDLGWCGTAH